MDEAERCHRISYISYGRLIASGTVAEVVAGSGLATLVVEGEGLDALRRELAGAPGVEQVAPFGNSLHVVESDASALEATLARLAPAAGARWRPAETSLEDVFIKFMTDSADNMASAA